jgi:hypothetical protein
MLTSYAKPLNTIELPFFKGEVSMLPFDLSDLSSLPNEFIGVVEQMVKNLPNRVGTAYLTVHGKFVKKDKTLRRGAPHIDGNYLPSVSSWGSGGGNGWKVGENGVKLNSQEHALSYANPNGGMLIASNYSACKGWVGKFNEDAKEGGDCSHIKLDEGFMLDANQVYYGNSQFIHESLPVDKDVFRVLFRVTLPMEYPSLEDQLN